MKVGLAEHPDFLKHDNGPGHPERPERLAAISSAVRRHSFGVDLVEMPTRNATRSELALVHGSAYLDRLEDTRARALTNFDADTRATDKSFDVALRAAGSAVSAVHESLTGTVRRSFVLGRPPGHHAEADRAMGFCLLNNAAIAAAAAIAHGGLDRVAVVDWDVHHGNGTAHVFASRSDVLYLSMHQYPHYPGTGAAHEIGSGAGAGFTVNIPLPAGCTDADYATVMDAIAIPILREYAPQLIIVSAGFDAHRDDPLAGMLLTGGGFASLTRGVVGIADEFAGGRIVHLLEGGYDLESLAEGVCAVLSVLIGGDADSDGGGSNRRDAESNQARPAAISAVRAVRAQHAEFWSMADQG
ncbi:MAG: histone deacetylase [Spirochaetia bacterium]